MKRLFIVLLCATVLTGSACSKKAKEVSPAAVSEAKMLINEAQFAMSVREYARAEELIRRSIKLNEDMPEYWVSLGMALRKQDKNDEARKAYKHALELHADRFKETKRPEELGQQAFVLGLLGKVDDATKLMEKGLKDFPDSDLMKRMAAPTGLQSTFKTEKFKELAL